MFLIIQQTFVKSTINTIDPIPSQISTPLASIRVFLITVSFMDSSSHHLVGAVLIDCQCLGVKSSSFSQTCFSELWYLTW